jgi:hypothetical protein
MTPPLPCDAADRSPASLQRLPARELTRLVQGLYFIFLGSLAVLAATVEVFVAAAMRPFHVLICGAGVVGVLAGSWRLCQVRALGQEWKLCTRGLLVLAGLMAYLFPFFCLWRNLPVNVYLLCHALVWIGAFICHTALLSSTMGVLGKLAGRPALVAQSMLFAGITFLTLFAPFALLSRELILVTSQGTDPLYALQLLIGQVPLLLGLGLLSPFALTLSLVWTTKDIAVQRLMAAGAAVEGNADRP